jgi:hypothetical protein
MAQPLNAAERPNRLSPVVHAITLALLGLSFVSGVLIWRGLHLQEVRSETPSWLRACVVFHGALNPFLCALFGYFVCDHIRVGWRLGANRVTGLLMEVCFAALILTGIGLYYSGGENFRAFCITAHRVLGVALPVCLAAHWVAANRWVQSISAVSAAR